MKKTILIGAIVASIASFDVRAQSDVPTRDTNVITAPTISGPAYDAIRFMASSSSNWFAVPYMTFNSGKQTRGEKFAGGGVAVGYKASQFVVPVMRMEYNNREWFMPSANLQLQLPLTLFGKVKLTPFAFTGLAPKIFNRQDSSVVGLFGAGMAVHITDKHSWKPNFVVWDYETWTGIGDQVRVGAGWNF